MPQQSSPCMLLFVLGIGQAPRCTTEFRIHRAEERLRGWVRRCDRLHCSTISFEGRSESILWQGTPYVQMVYALCHDCAPVCGKDAHVPSLSMSGYSLSMLIRFDQILVMLIQFQSPPTTFNDSDLHSWPCVYLSWSCESCERLEEAHPLCGIDFFSGTG
jgi:hypothetical protein